MLMMPVLHYLWISWEFYGFILPTGCPNKHLIVLQEASIHHGDIILTKFTVAQNICERHDTQLTHLIIELGKSLALLKAYPK